MAKILCIETSTDVCSAALVENGKLRISTEEYVANSHAALLTVLIEKMMNKADMKLTDIDAVAVSSGPGSYTGLRIGISTAKGICYAADKPLIALISLRILVEQACLMHGIVNSEDILLCPMIDARRMEVYTTLFDNTLNQLDEIKAEIITPESFSSQLEKQKVAFFGNGAAKCKEVIQHPNAIFLDNIFPLASAMALPAHQTFLESRFEDTAYFEPFYLKDFIATMPKKK
ncbi:MAG: tRNA (adenosine(37)-N6)-threonylcarbamoyltransferase complex dimerization subunit type 1 TsaB [Cytophagaceae bacterium]|jgi:tRNA threonylcarbamoyladenosine biosynthesis protein TsaB|nr:tRNA (adenosine(37)-N6)-threonylcarbamoyltransferase complex dimerization subunit type 1 TsaB [Cytophagaceae bacterium]